MSGLLALDMANAAALAAAVRVQSAIREYLETQGVNDVLSDSVAPAQALLRTFEQSGISDHSAPRGRRIKRVTERVVTRMRKKNGTCEPSFGSAGSPWKKSGKARGMENWPHCGGVLSCHSLTCLYINKDIHLINDILARTLSQLLAH